MGRRAGEEEDSGEGRKSKTMRRKNTRMLTMNMRKRRWTRRRMSMTSRRVEAMQRRGVWRMRKRRREEG